MNGFTLDPSLGEFILSHQNIRIPKRGKIYSVNEGNSLNWDEPTTKWINNFKKKGAVRQNKNSHACTEIARLTHSKGTTRARDSSACFAFLCSLFSSTVRSLCWCHGW